MRALIQRVKSAKVTVENQTVGKIDKGILILLGIHESDQLSDIGYLVKKCANLRIFPDLRGKMNLSLLETDLEVLVVSQFTLYAETRKGNRPSYIQAAKPEIAEPLYEAFVLQLGEMLQKSIETGRFGAMMEVALINDGPVTLIVDSQ